MTEIGLTLLKRLIHENLGVMILIKLKCAENLFIENTKL